MVKTKHPIFRDYDSEWYDADDELEVQSGGSIRGAIPAFADRLFGIARKQEEEEEDES